MPTICIDMFEGRTPKQKKDFVKALTQAAVNSLGLEPTPVDVFIYALKKSDWPTGRKLWSDKG